LQRRAPYFVTPNLEAPAQVKTAPTTDRSCLSNPETIYVRLHATSPAVFQRFIDFWNRQMLLPSSGLDRKLYEGRLASWVQFIPILASLGLLVQAPSLGQNKTSNGNRRTTQEEE